MEKVKLLKISSFTMFHNVICAICILKSFDSHILVVICSFFNFGMVSQWCIREWVKALSDWKIIVAQMMNIIFKREENMVGKDTSDFFVFKRLLSQCH